MAVFAIFAAPAAAGPTWAVREAPRAASNRPGCVPPWRWRRCTSRGRGAQPACPCPNADTACAETKRVRPTPVPKSTGRENPLPNPIITLTTDYGLNDHLVGTLKGVILKINPDVTIVDISHDVTPYDLLDGALTIGSSYSYFPPRTIHVVVVDPGVGTERRPLLVTGDTQYFVAPDNGVLSLVYEREENILVRHANVEHYYLQPVSKTFHGRDVFPPIAGWLAN